MPDTWCPLLNGFEVLAPSASLEFRGRVGGDGNGGCFAEQLSRSGRTTRSPTRHCVIQMDGLNELSLRARRDANQPRDLICILNLICTDVGVLTATGPCALSEISDYSALWADLAQMANTSRADIFVGHIRQVTYILVHRALAIHRL